MSEQIKLSIYDIGAYTSESRIMAATWWANFSGAALERCRGNGGVECFFEAGRSLAVEWGGRLDGTYMYFETEADLTVFLLRWA